MVVTYPIIPIKYKKANCVSVSADEFKFWGFTVQGITNRVPSRVLSNRENKTFEALITKILKARSLHQQHTLGTKQLLKLYLEHSHPNEGTAADNTTQGM